MSAYDPHQSFIAPARASASLHRLFAGVVVFVIAVMAFQFGLVRVLQGLESWDRLQFDLMIGSTPQAMLITLYSFGLITAALWVVVRLLHDRSISSLLGPLAPAFADFFKVFRWLIVLFAALMLLPSPPDQQPSMHMSFATWLPLLLPALIGVLVQTGTEELIFRGYLQSQLAARFSHPVIWMVIPSIIFGALHLDPATYGENATFIALWAVGFGIAAADLTARAGNLGPAMAMHFVNNVVAILIVAMPDNLDGLALLVVPYGPQDIDILRAALWIEGPILLCMWLTARIAIRR